MIDCMSAKSIDLLWLQETRAPSTTHYMIENYTFILFGGGGNEEYRGVGLVIRNSVKPAIKGFYATGPRWAFVGLKTAPRNVSIGT
eukprot:6867605-Alexandrium_andersonii.AAC.1